MLIRSSWQNVVVAFAWLARVWLAEQTDLYVDTAYYLDWSRRLDWGYFDHPAGIAWLLRVCGVPLSMLLVSLATVLLPVAVVTACGKPEARSTAAVIGAVTPFYVLSSVMLNPDSGMLVAGLAAFALAARGRVLWAGLAFGVALTFKYSAVLLAPGLLLLAWQSGARLSLVGAVALSLLGVLPTLWWNWTHEFIGFAFQARHGTQANEGGLMVGLELVASQCGMLGPLFFPVMLWWLKKAPPEQRAWQWAVGLPLMLFFSLGFVAKGEANWPAMASIAGVPAVAMLLHERQKLLSVTVTLSGLVSLTGVLFLTVPTSFTPLSDPIHRLHGWSVLARLKALHATAAFAPHYTVAGELAAYTGLSVGVLSSRPSQYDIWGFPALEPGADALWVSEDGAPPPEALSARFSEVEGAPTLKGFFGAQVVHEFHVWRLVGFKRVTRLDNVKSTLPSQVLVLHRHWLELPSLFRP
jgi:hypothetical protein